MQIKYKNPETSVCSVMYKSQNRHGDVRECDSISDGSKTYRKICIEVIRSPRRDNDGMAVLMMMMMMMMMMMICVRLQAINIYINHHFI
jgi:hypothetical protein